MPPSISCRLPLRLAHKTNTASTTFSSVFVSQRRDASILSQLSDIKSSYNKRIRVGRGPSSGYGKTSGRGHKGQKQHGKVPRGFEGGQTPVAIIKGKRGFVNTLSKDFAKVPLTKIQSWVAQGRLDPQKPITPRELIISKCVSNAKDGIKLLATSRSHELSLDKQGPLTIPLNIIVSRASAQAIAAVEKAGGTIMTRYYTKFAMDQILKGNMDPIRSLRSEPIESEGDVKTYKYRLPDATSRKAIEYYRDEAKRGYLAYTVGEHEGPSLFHKPPRDISREEIEERRRRRGTGAGTGIDSRKAKLDVDANKMW